jgi:hypothetical protein
MSAILERERSRSRMRLATVTVGVAALATAGVVAYNLPTPPQKTTANTGATPATSTTPAAPVRYPGDDSGEGQQVAAPTTAPGGTATRAPSHTTSGGS